MNPLTPRPVGSGWIEHTYRDDDRAVAYDFGVWYRLGGDTFEFGVSDLYTILDVSYGPEIQLEVSLDSTGGEAAICRWLTERIRDDEHELQRLEDKCCEDADAMKEGAA